MNKEFIMSINLNVLEHLGINLYSNTPAVLSEVVANSWDADAENVAININKENQTIEIIDDGHGMSFDDINSKYLLIGYRKREENGGLSPKHKRKVMGRKGIGKLSLFSIADIIEIHTKKNDEENAFRLDAKEIKEKIKKEEGNYKPSSIIFLREGINDSGTKIILKNIKKNINQTQDNLKKRLARRFSIIGEQYKFSVSVNNDAISIEDRDYFHKIEYLWYYGKESQFYADSCIHAKTKNFENDIVSKDFNDWKIKGWIGTVKHSGSLEESKSESLNKITILVRGKVAQENILDAFRLGGLFTKYLIGEIHADFLDFDTNKDISTSNRQSLKEDDERYIALKDFLYKEIKKIGQERAENKKNDAIVKMGEVPSMKKWYQGLKGDTKAKAKKMFGRMNQIADTPEERRELFQQGIFAFEILKHKDALDAIEMITTKNLKEIIDIFIKYERIEADMYYGITSGRIKIIKKLLKHTQENTLEKILQEYIFEHLWLLDPSWDKATETPAMEVPIKASFGKISDKMSEEIKKGRIDIKYKKISGTHVIIELKRASIKIEAEEISQQMKKYIKGLQQEINRDKQKHEYIEAICVVGNKNQYDKNDFQVLDGRNIKVLTYNELLDNAYKNYQEYLDKKKEAGIIYKLIDDIEKEITELSTLKEKN